MIAWLVRWRWGLTAALLGVLAALGPGVMRAAQPDNALTVWFLQDDPKLQSYHAFQDTFGNDELVIVQLHDPQGVMRAPTLARMSQAQARFEQVQGVAQVHSVLTAQTLRRAQPAPDAPDAPDAPSASSLSGKLARALAAARPDTLELAPLLELGPTPDGPSADALDQARQRALGDPTVRGWLLNDDATRALMIVQLQVMGDIDLQRDRIVRQLRQAAQDTLGPLPHALGGIGVIYAGLNEITTRDFGLFVSLGYLIMFIMLWVIFRSMRLVAAALGVIVVGTWVSLGVYGSVGNQLNTMTIVLPTLIIVLGVADAVHFPVALLKARERARQDDSSAPRDRAQLAVQGLKAAALPCAMTTLTTALGFLALTSSPMKVIQDLGLYAALGVAAALGAAMLLMALAFMSLPPQQRLPEQPGIQRALRWLGRSLQRRPWRWAALCAALSALGALGASRVTVDTYTLGALPDDHQVVRDHHAIETGWGFYSTLEFMVRPRDAQARVDDPALLAALERLAWRAQARPDVGQVMHLGQLYRHGARTLDPSLGPRDPLPEPVALAAQQLAQRPQLVWDTSDPRSRDNPLAAWMTSDGRVARVTLTAKMASAKALGQQLRQLQALADQELGPLATWEPTGYPPLYVSIIDHVMDSQLRGFGLALTLIFAVMLLWLRSLRLAIISLVPNLFPVVMMMGVMGALGIHLDIATATVAAIVIGVAIDDTVHFLHAWRQAERQGLSWSQCLEHTLQRAGRAAVVTTLLLVTGFPVLMAADVATVVDFGLLTTVAALAALFADLILLPLTLRLWPKRAGDPAAHSPRATHDHP